MIYIVNTLFIVFIRTIKGVFFIIKINSRKIYFVEEITYNPYQIFRKYVVKQIHHEPCEILYPLNINIDYFPTNFIVGNELLWYIDYECNDYMEEWNFENLGHQILV